MVSRLTILAAVLGFCWVSAGCGGGGTGPATPSMVQGIVTLDGQALTAGTVNFASHLTGNSAIATVGADGKFTVPGGMVPGEYKIIVTPRTPTPENPTPPESKIPEKYRRPDTSDLTSRITSGRNDVKLELKS